MTEQDLSGMSVEEQIDIIEASEENLLKTIEVGDKLEKLQRTPEWQDYIEEFYLEKQSVRLVLLKARALANKNEDLVADIERQITGIGEFNEFINKTIALQEAAKEKLASNRDLVSQLRKEADSATDSEV